MNREGRVLLHTVVITCRVNGTVKFLTKGDNNSVDDRGLYAPGQLWLTKKDVVGRARGFLPYVGMVTIYMNEYPKFKVSEYNKTYIACIALCFSAEAFKNLWQQQDCINSGCQVARVTKLCLLVPNVYGFLAWTLLYVTFLLLRILIWLLDFWKICVPLGSSLVLNS